MTRSPHRPIATVNEGPLHAALKTWYMRGEDRVEVPIDGRQIDIVRGELLIEIQTSSFAAIREKLGRLLADHPVRVVHPVARERWIVRRDDEGRVLGRRRSPKRGRLEDVFHELVSLARLLAQRHFSLEILLTKEEEVRMHEPGRAWRRRGWVTVERRLLDVLESQVFDNARDLQRLLPSGLPDPWTTADLAEGLSIPRDLAQKMAYCLREAGVFQSIGKRGRARAYRVES